MIKETDTSLRNYGKQLLKTRKEVLSMADKYCDIDYRVVEKVYRYEDIDYWNLFLSTYSYSIIYFMHSILRSDKIKVFW